ncbi:hypothetical protein V8C40DRAFT_258083 [Trichoderma camerunense]
MMDDPGRYYEFCSRASLIVPLWNLAYPVVLPQVHFSVCRYKHCSIYGDMILLTCSLLLMWLILARGISLCLLDTVI